MSASTARNATIEDAPRNALPRIEGSAFFLRGNTKRARSGRRRTAWRTVRGESVGACEGERRGERGARAGSCAFIGGGGCPLFRCLSGSVVVSPRSLIRQLHYIPHSVPPRGGTPMRYSVTLPHSFQPRRGNEKSLFWGNVVF